MANDETDEVEASGEENAYDASFRLDTKTLSKQEQNFARMLGFGEEGQEATAVDAAESPPGEEGAASPEPSPIPSSASEPFSLPPPAATEAHAENELGDSSTPTSTESDTADSSAQAGADDDVARDPAPDDANSAPRSPQSARTRPARDWEEIHPRPAAKSRQSALIERAECILRNDALQSTPPSSAAPTAPSPVASNDAVVAAAAHDAEWRASIQERDVRIEELEAAQRALEEALVESRRASAANAETTPAPEPAHPESLDKELEELRVERDALLLEREQLGDQLSVAHAARHDAEARAERLEAAVRSVRSPNGPLPDGERALRAEVVGLRRRIEDAQAESRQLREGLAAAATDLAIARAERDDRLHELDQQRERIAQLEGDRAAQMERLDESIARQRELLALVARVQAENVELRSTQAALEETLEARDLEISAREEHLVVTRRGLAARDAQLLEAEERLEHERHRRELAEAETERVRLGQQELEDRLARREARIAVLSTTLARIEEAIGRGGLDRTSERALHAVSTSIATAGFEPEASVDARDPSAEPIDALRSATAAPGPERAPDSSATESHERSATPSAESLFARWRDERLQALGATAAGESVADYWAARIAPRLDGETASPVEVVSLAGTTLDAEVALVRAAARRGGPSLRVRVLERAPERAAARQAVIEAGDARESITVEIWDPASEPAGEPAPIVLLWDALFGDAELEALLDRVLATSAPDAVVLFADRIAGGPIALSEAALEKLRELWSILPESWSEDPAFRRPPEAGDDGGTPVPDADLLAAILARCSPRATVGFGPLADLVVGPARIASLAALVAQGASGQALLESIDALDEHRGAAEALAPRHAVGVLVRGAESEGGDASGRETFGLPWPGASR